MKEKMEGALGALGGILWFILSMLYCFSPFLVLHLPIWLEFILFMVMLLVPVGGEIVRMILYVWAVIVAFGHPLDVFTIIFFVIAVIYFFTTLVPFFASFKKKEEPEE